jgi:hypothetical protein
MQDSSSRTLESAQQQRGGGESRAVTGRIGIRAATARRRRITGSSWKIFQALPTQTDIVILIYKIINNINYYLVY